MTETANAKNSSTLKKKNNNTTCGKKESTQLHSILFSEVFEFLAEVARGDFDRALEEAGDVMAVLYRALNGEGRQA